MARLVLIGHAPTPETGKRLTLKLKDPHTIVGGYDWCYCGRVKHTEKPFPTDTYCHCSTGWYQSLFEAAFGKPVKVRLVQSILQGANRCEFEIEFG